MKTERRQISKEMREAEKQKQFDLKQKKRRRSTKVIKRKEYLDYSERAIWVRAKKSTHYIHLTEPEIIAESVNNMKGEV